MRLNLSSGMIHSEAKVRFSMKLMNILSTSLVVSLYSVSASAQMDVKFIGDGKFTISNSGDFPLPVIIENFDNPDTITTTYHTGGDVEVVSTSDTIFGPNLGRANFYGTNYNSTIEYKNLGGLTEIFVSYYVKIKKLSGDDSRNVKLLRITAGYDGGYLEPTMGITEFHSSDSAIVYNYPGNGEPENLAWIESTPKDSWRRIEMYIKLSSTPGAGDGTMELKFDGNTVYSADKIITRNVNRAFEWATFPYYVAHDPGGDYIIEYDNIAILNSKQRLEVCSASEYNLCNDAIVINPTVENALVTLDTTKLRKTKNYLYIFDANGVMNEKGISLGSPPSIPNNVIIKKDP